MDLHAIKLLTSHLEARAAMLWLSFVLSIIKKARFCGWRQGGNINE